MSILSRYASASLKLAILLVSAVSLAPSSAHAQDMSRPVIDVGVVVSDLDRSVQFYQDVLGMTTSRSFDLDADFGERSGLTDARPVHIEALKLEDSEQATEWKLMSFEDAPTQDSEHIHDHMGMQYITIRVDALDPFLERIQAHDIELLGETPISLADGNHFVLIQDPDGTFIELIGPLENE
jgi:catechol 2,3-dioxygenase-like lactoylglutathione lyase family enzyme